MSTAKDVWEKYLEGLSPKERVEVKSYGDKMQQEILHYEAQASQQRRRDMFEKVALVMLKNSGAGVPYDLNEYLGEKDEMADVERDIAKSVAAWTTFILESADKFAKGEE